MLYLPCTLTRSLSSSPLLPPLHARPPSPPPTSVSSDGGYTRLPPDDFPGDPSDEPGGSSWEESSPSTAADYQADYFTSPADSSFPASSLLSLAAEYSFPLPYLASFCSQFGVPPPVPTEAPVGTFLNAEQCHALLEAVTTLDPSAVEAAFVDGDLEELADDIDRPLGEVFAAAVETGARLPFGVRSPLAREDAEAILRRLGVDEEEVEWG